MGLLAVPRLKPAAGGAAGLGKKAKNKVGGQSWERSGEGGEGEDDDGEDGDEGDEEDAHAQFGGAAAGSEDEEEDEDEGEEDEEEDEEDEEDEDGELVLRPKTRKGTPRDRLVRLLERSQAEQRSGASGKKPAAAAAGDADLFTVKRRILWLGLGLA
jgi:hypothetical protein